MIERTLLVLDTETTGLDPVRDSLIEIAARVVVVRRNEGTTGPEVISGASYDRQVWPSRPVSAEAAKVNGFTAEAWSGALPVEEAIADFARWVAEHVPAGAILCGHNVGFDVAFLKAAFKRAGLEWPFSHRVIDTQSLSAFDLLAGRVESTSLANMAKLYGVENLRPHVAYSDVLTTVALLRALMDKYLLF